MKLFLANKNQGEWKSYKKHYSSRYKKTKMQFLNLFQQD